MSMIPYMERLRVCLCTIPHRVSRIKLCRLLVQSLRMAVRCETGTDKDTVAVWLGRGGAKILKYYTGAALKWFVVEDSRHGCSHQTGVEHPTLNTEIQSRH